MLEKKEEGRNPFVNQVASFCVSVSLKKNNFISTLFREPPLKKIVVTRITSLRIDIIHDNALLLLVIY